MHRSYGIPAITGSNEICPDLPQIEKIKIYKGPRGVTVYSYVPIIRLSFYLRSSSYTALILQLSDSLRSSFHRFHRHLTSESEWQFLSIKAELAVSHVDTIESTTKRCDDTTMKEVDINKETDGSVADAFYANARNATST